MLVAEAATFVLAADARCDMEAGRLAALKRKFQGYQNILKVIESNANFPSDGGEELLSRLEALNVKDGRVSSVFSPSGTFTVDEFDAFCRDVAIKGAERVARGEPWHG